jgi:hypothetical protein
MRCEQKKAPMLPQAFFAAASLPACGPLTGRTSSRWQSFCIFNTGAAIKITLTKPFTE